MDFSKFASGFNQKTLLELYQQLLLPRKIEEKMLILLRQGKISKWFSGIGQEAISVAIANAMDHDEFILPMHRNLGVFTSRNIDLKKLFLQFQGKKEGFTKGRDRSFHFGSLEHHIVGMISHLGPQMGIADGIALAHKLSNEHKITAVFSGDGGTSEGDFHEAINVAAVWDLPVIFIIENNGYGLSTPSIEQFKCKQFIDKAIGYGIEGIQVDGNNILEVHSKFSAITKEIRKNPRPIIFECLTFRMRGHEEASGTKYIPKELMETWAKKDPIVNYETYLLQQGILTPEVKKNIESDIQIQINEAVDSAFSHPDLEVNTEEEKQDIFIQHNSRATLPSKQNMQELRLVDAISDGLKTAMQKDDRIVLMGQDIAEYGGVFKVTEGFIEEFGKERVRNTPLCESAIVGTALGLSLKGYKPVMEMQFADFVSCGFNQIVNNLAKLQYRWGGKADVVIRMPTGAGVGAGPFHSQSNEAWFFHTPGLKIVYPSNPYDAKGLLLEAINDPNPVLFFEHKALYRSLRGMVPINEYYTCEIGKAQLLSSGNDATIITYGMGVIWAKEVLQKITANIDLIDLTTLAPLDTERIFNSVKKTGKALILHEDNLTGGIGAEIAALITEHCFEFLDAPIMRVGALDTPVPFNSKLEKNYLPQQRFENKLSELLNY